MQTTNFAAALTHPPIPLNAMPPSKILLVDDEPDIVDVLSIVLSEAGFDVTTAGNGVEALAAARQQRPDLILLDVMMPEMDGVETCSQLRQDPTLKDCLVAFLTARGEDYSQIAGFDAGADDYILKPVKPKVLVSRVKALLRRSDPLNAEGSEAGKGPEIFIDVERYVVIAHGEELSLPRKEFELLRLLASQPGKVFTREAILSGVWGDDVVVGDRTIDVHIRKLREKLGNDRFKTVKGVGYKFEG
jgi:two-component system alkaline phosphatase synthesis response regulator PhoP